MEQHPVPQHIASFEFKLFGNLTMRQFIKLAIPAGIGTLIFFTDPIAPVLRIPLAVIFVVLGLFIAFVPIGGMPFEKWVVAFLKAIFSPTLRIWTKEKNLPEFLSHIIRPPVHMGSPEPITEQGKEKLLSYLRSIPQEEMNQLDFEEKAALSRLGLKGVKGEGGKLPPAIIWPFKKEEQELPYGLRSSLPQVEPIPIQEGGDLGARIVATPHLTRSESQGFVTPTISSHAKPYALSGLGKRLAGGPKASLKKHLASSFENVLPIQTSGNRVKLVHGIGKTRVRKLHFGPPEGFDLSKLPIKGEARFDLSEQLKKGFHFDESLFNTPEPEKKAEAVVVPEAPKKSMPKKITKHRQLMPQPVARLSTPQNVTMKPAEKQILDTKAKFEYEKPKDSGEALVSRAQIIPLTSKPNVLSGLVADLSGVPVIGAILTVRDANGIPVRALKTNKLGQFLSATSLGDGQYTVEVEASNLSFRPISLNLSGQVLAPLEIKAYGGAG